ncbi:MAG: RNase family protein [Bacillales bacterium]|nr:RNase family protein [Bacillales bacterium]
MVHVYFDGASKGSPGNSAIGVFINNQGNVQTFKGSVGFLSSHEAEWKAFIKALEICLDQGYTQILIHSDSKIIVDSVEKRYVKNTLFKNDLVISLKLISKFEQFFLKWVPSKENKADLLAREALHL